MVDPAGVAVAVGNGFTVTLTAVDESTHPLLLVTTTLYDPLAVAVKFALVAPLILPLALRH